MPRQAWVFCCDVCVFKRHMFLTQSPAAHLGVQTTVPSRQTKACVLQVVAILLMIQKQIDDACWCSNTPMQWYALLHFQYTVASSSSCCSNTLALRPSSPGNIACSSSDVTAARAERYYTEHHATWLLSLIKSKCTLGVMKAVKLAHQVTNHC